MTDLVDCSFGETSEFLLFYCRGRFDTFCFCCSWSATVFIALSRSATVFCNFRLEHCCFGRGNGDFLAFSEEDVDTGLAHLARLTELAGEYDGAGEDD